MPTRSSSRPIRMVPAATPTMVAVYGSDAPERDAPTARRMPMSRVFSCTIDQKIASTSPAHTMYTIENSVRMSSRSFSTGPMKSASFSSQVMIITASRLGGRTARVSSLRSRSRNAS